MEKHLLLTVRDDKQVNPPLHFIKNFFANHCDVRLTLLYVVTIGGSWNYDPMGLSEESKEEERMAKAKKAKGEQVLGYAKDWIVKGGCEAAKIETKVVYSGEGVAPAIVDEARKGLYDAVFLGRRGLSWFEEMVEDSVSLKVLWEEIDFPVWCCRRTELIPRQNVLLCVLGNEAETRMADHVGFMLEGEEQHKVTLLHVSSREMGEAELEELVKPHRAELLNNGIAESRIEARAVSARNAEKAILEEAESGRYAVVAVGRQKGEPRGLRRIFPDSISGRLMRSIENACLWVSK
jgi:nucleotide-binding universal stress UspA family protein